MINQILVYIIFPLPLWERKVFHGFAVSKSLKNQVRGNLVFLPPTLPLPRKGGGKLATIFNDIVLFFG